MDNLRKNCRRTRLDRTRNDRIREIMEMKKIYRRGAERTVGHSNRMKETRWPREVVKWALQEKGKRGWRDDMKGATETRDTAEEDCYRRGEWGLGEGKGRQL
jgi:hypothetical protein